MIDDDDNDDDDIVVVVVVVDDDDVVDERVPLGLHDNHVQSEGFQLSVSCNPWTSAFRITRLSCTKWRVPAVSILQSMNECL